MPTHVPAFSQKSHDSHDPARPTTLPFVHPVVIPPNQSLPSLWSLLHLVTGRGVLAPIALHKYPSFVLFEENCCQEGLEPPVGHWDHDGSATTDDKAGDSVVAIWVPDVFCYRRYGCPSVPSAHLTFSIRALWFVQEINFLKSTWLNAPWQLEEPLYSGAHSSWGCF